MEGVPHAAAVLSLQPVMASLKCPHTMTQVQLSLLQLWASTPSPAPALVGPRLTCRGVGRHGCACCWPAQTPAPQVRYNTSCAAYARGRTLEKTVIQSALVRSLFRKLIQFDDFHHKSALQFKPSSPSLGHMSLSAFNSEMKTLRRLLILPWSIQPGRHVGDTLWSFTVASCCHGWWWFPDTVDGGHSGVRGCALLLVLEPLPWRRLGALAPEHDPGSSLPRSPVLEGFLAQA